jgi:hypothetical protein
MASDGPIYAKFKVERTDGTSAPSQKHDGCDYFVLDVTHDPHAIPALLAYAQSCAPAGFAQLAASIREMVAARAALERK